MEQTTKSPNKQNLRAITKLLPHSEYEWCVTAFALNRDMITKDGTLDPLHGVIFALGSFATQEEAEAHRKYVIEQTGHAAVIVSRYGAATPLTRKPLRTRETVKDKLAEVNDSPFALKSEIGPMSVQENYNKMIVNAATALQHCRMYKKAQDQFYRSAHNIRLELRKTPDLDQSVFDRFAGLREQVFPPTTDAAGQLRQLSDEIFQEMEDLKKYVNSLD
jgi:hypothetical protein